MTEIYDYIVVGDGIAARCVLWQLAQSTNFKNKKILQISSKDFYPPCTESTTSIISLDIHESGISALGDIIAQSTNNFSEFTNTFGPSGVFKTSQYYLAPDRELDKKKYISFCDRYGKIEEFNNLACAKKPAFIIDSSQYMNWLQDEYTSKLLLTKLSSEVINHKIGAKQILLRNDQKFKYTSKIIFCTGAYANLLCTSHKGKSVSGSYLEFCDVLGFDESFILSSGHFNIIYRNHDKKILFGGTSFQGLSFLDDKNSLKENYSRFKDVFKVNLPDFDSGLVQTGIRHKGVKRMPNFKVEGDTIFLDSLYKNGFVFSMHFAQKIRAILN